MGGDLAILALGELYQVRTALGLGNSSDCPGILGAGPASALPCVNRARWLLGFTGIDAAWEINTSCTSAVGQVQKQVPRALVGIWRDHDCSLIWVYVLTQSHLDLCESMDCVARQASLSMGLPRQEYWNGLPLPSPGDLPDPGMKSLSPVSPTLAGGFFTTEPPGKPHSLIYNFKILRHA